ncbi:MAG: hypothetical protein EA357_11505 [Micavibrio sp.]|nr:MAG: hypothetical protein EA357_11505 [Micavibrio sp.]
MGKVKYYAESARHQFAKVAYGKDGLRAPTTAALLTFALGIGGTYALLDKSPDNITTPQTETVLAEIRSDLSMLQENYQTLRGLNARIANGEFSTAELPELQQQRLAERRAFLEQAHPILNRVLLSPHLSERQARDLMADFSATIEPVAGLGDRYDVKNFGWLREKRAKVLNYPGNYNEEFTISSIQREIERKNSGQWVAITFIGILLAPFALLAGNITDRSNRNLQKWARKKPQKPQKPKH